MSMLPPVAPEHLHDDRGPGFAVGSIILGVVAVLAVILRVVSRKIKGLKFQADDYWIFASLVSANCSHATSVETTFEVDE